MAKEEDILWIITVLGIIHIYMHIYFVHTLIINLTLAKLAVGCQILGVHRPFRLQSYPTTVNNLQG